MAYTFYESKIVLARVGTLLFLALAIELMQFDGHQAPQITHWDSGLDIVMPSVQHPEICPKF